MDHHFVDAPLDSPVQEGQCVFIRTVSNYYTGRIIGLSSKEIVLEEAAWIAATGRFHQAMATGSFNEVEPYPDDTTVSVSRGAIVDVSTWNHQLPRDPK